MSCASILIYGSGVRSIERMFSINLGNKYAVAMLLCNYTTEHNLRFQQTRDRFGCGNGCPAIEI